MDAYQGGIAYQVYSPQGSKPLDSLKVTGGSVRKEYDKLSKSQVIAMEQQASKITVPKAANTGALLVHPIVVVQLFIGNATTLLSVEFVVVDQLGKRRLTFSNSFASIQPNPQHCKFPLQNIPRNQWADFIFDVRQLHHNVYETRASVGFRGVESITLTGAHIRVRRIYTLKEVPPVSPAPQVSCGPGHQPPGGGPSGAAARGTGAAAHGHGGLYHMHVPSQFTLPQDVEQTQILIARGDELALPLAVAPLPPHQEIPQNKQQGVKGQKGAAPRANIPAAPHAKATPQQNHQGAPTTQQQAALVTPGGTRRYLDPASYPITETEEAFTSVGGGGGGPLRMSTSGLRSSVTARHRFSGAAAVVPQRSRMDMAAEEQALFLVNSSSSLQQGVVLFHEHPTLAQLHLSNHNQQASSAVGTLEQHDGAASTTSSVTAREDRHSSSMAPHVCRSYTGPQSPCAPNTSDHDDDSDEEAFVVQHAAALGARRGGSGAGSASTESAGRQSYRDALYDQGALRPGSATGNSVYHSTCVLLSPCREEFGTRHADAEGGPPPSSPSGSASSKNRSGGESATNEPPSIEGSHRQHRQKDHRAWSGLSAARLSRPEPPMTASAAGSSLYASVDPADVYASVALAAKRDSATVRQLRMSESTVLTGGDTITTTHHRASYQLTTYHQEQQQQAMMRTAAREALLGVMAAHHGGHRSDLGAANNASSSAAAPLHEARMHHHHNDDGVVDIHQTADDTNTSFQFPRYDLSPPSTASRARYDEAFCSEDDDGMDIGEDGDNAADPNAFYVPVGSSSSSSASSSSTPLADKVQSTENLLQPSVGSSDGSNQPSVMSSSTEQRQFEELLEQQKQQRHAQHRAAVIDNATSQPWAAPPSRRGPATCVSALSPPPPVRISQELGAAGSSPPHPLSLDDKTRYEYDPVVGCYFDRVSNRFVKPPSHPHPHHHQHHSAPPMSAPTGHAAASVGGERGASPGQRAAQPNPRRPQSTR